MVKNNEIDIFGCVAFCLGIYFISLTFLVEYSCFSIERRWISCSSFSF